MGNISRHELDGRTLAYCWSHQPHPQPLVVLHGLGDSSIHTYAPRFAATALRNTPALFIDLPGFGEGFATQPYPSTIESMADDVAHLLSALGVHRAPMFAHSMGANVAISLSTKHPTLVAKHILAEPLLVPEQSVLAAGIARRSEKSFIATGYEILARATRLQANRGDIAAHAFLTPLNMASPVAMHRAATSLLQERNPSFLAMLQSLPGQPMLLVGERTAADNATLNRNSLQVTEIPNAGHFMIAEASESTACVILNLVKSMHNEE